MPHVSGPMARKAVEEFLSTRATAADRDVAMFYLDRLRAGKFPKLWVDWVFQNGWSGHIDIVDAWCFSEFWTMLHTRQLRVFFVTVGTTPANDNEVEANQERLRAVQPPFRAEFYYSRSDEDGHIEWSEPVGAKEFLVPDVTRPEMDKFDAIVEAGSAPLEVGLQGSAKTIQNLKANGVLARWPYGLDQIVVVRVSPNIKFEVPPIC